MLIVHRRQILFLAASGLAAGGSRPVLAQAGGADGKRQAEAIRFFVREAERMRQRAVAAGDQSYGAVVVLEGRIVGWGPSRVQAIGSPQGHAEQVAIKDAQLRLGANSLDGAVMYSTSIPCTSCQIVAAGAGIARLYHGPEATDAGAPRSRR